MLVNAEDPYDLVEVADGSHDFMPGIAGMTKSENDSDRNGSKWS